VGGPTGFVVDTVVPFFSGRSHNNLVIAVSTCIIQETRAMHDVRCLALKAGASPPLIKGKGSGKEASVQNMSDFPSSIIPICTGVRFPVEAGLFFSSLLRPDRL
jgi:hypothetical protein